jgi:hypothetical protein
LLSKIGILWHNRTRKIIKSYLEDRFQKAEIISNALHNTSSEWGKITHGVCCGYFCSIMDYGIRVWDNSAYNKYFQVIKKAVAIITNTMNIEGVSKSNAAESIAQELAKL